MGAGNEEGMTTLNDQSAVPPHPLGIRPLGNSFVATQDLKQGLGAFAALPDELIVQILEWLEVPELLALGCCCKALYAFCRLDDLWKAKAIESGSSVRRWHGSWRSTCLGRPNQSKRHVDCTNLFSDVLYRPFYCAHSPLRPFASYFPVQNRIERLDHLSLESFNESWTNTPFILTRPVKEWPCFKSWSMDSLAADFGDVAFRAEAVDWPLSLYTQYMRGNQDESPLYLFDRSFVEKMSHPKPANGCSELPTSDLSANASADNIYSTPACFRQDLFTALGPHRPDHRWLIIGPERSGSTFHKDPNGTSAWNAVIRGSKYWIMFSSSSSLSSSSSSHESQNTFTPPGVFVSADESEVTSPLSITEWLLNFHAQARRTPGCKEGVCHAGEVLHVPSGWWHLVVNLEESIAITQNFVPREHLPKVLAFMRDKPDQVSGFKKNIESPYDLFCEKLEKTFPELLRTALEALNMSSGHSRASDTRSKRKWDEVVQNKAHIQQNGVKKVATEEHDDNAASFQFGFGDEELDDN